MPSSFHVSGRILKLFPPESLLPLANRCGGRATDQKARLPLIRIIAIVVIAAFLAFSLQNTQSVDFQFLTWDLGTAPVLVAILAAGFVGLVVGLLLSAPSLFRDRAARRRLEGELDAANTRASEAQVDAEATRVASLPQRARS